jgi:hypothetical protein
MRNGISNKSREIKEMKKQTKLRGKLELNIKLYSKRDVLRP